MIRKKKVSLITIGVTLALGAAWAGHRHGNGGDHARATFLKLGHAVVDVLEQTNEGQELVKLHDLNTVQLRDQLTINVVSVAQGILIDNGGSVVEAIGEPGKIVLSSDAWLQHFEKEYDVYYLVFHEMLRAVGVNDDDYIISKAINPFPTIKRVNTRMTSVYPLLGDDLLKDVIDPAKIGFGGTGCAREDLTATMSDFDEERNLLELRFRKYGVTAVGDVGYARKQCAIIIPVKARAGKRIVITQVDFTAKVALPIDETETGFARISLEAFLPGQTGPVMSKRLIGDAQIPQAGRLLIRKTDAVKSNCGESTLLRLNTTALVMNANGDYAVVEPDRVSVYLGVEDCTAKVAGSSGAITSTIR
jgi:hypothetical protein